jgi:hypothetical protein
MINKEATHERIHAGNNLVHSFCALLAASSVRFAFMASCLDNLSTISIDWRELGSGICLI